MTSDTDLSLICEDICGEVSRLQFHPDYIDRATSPGRKHASPWVLENIGMVGKSYLNMKFRGIKIKYGENNKWPSSTLFLTGYNNSSHHLASDTPLSISMEFPNIILAGTMPTAEQDECEQVELYNRETGWLYYGHWVSDITNFLVDLRSDITLDVDLTLSQYREETLAWHSSTEQRHRDMLERIEARYARD